MALTPAIGGLRIRGLSKRYGDTQALDDLELDALPGEILGVAGPNGAGKSTLIKILAGEVVADAGEILLDGAAWHPATERDRAAVVHQEPQLFPNLSIAENLMVGRESRTLLRRDLNADERQLLSDLGILELADRPLATVSLAIQQRVEIGRALARDARVFLFDEPNSALTPEESTDLFSRMHALAEQGRIVLLVSHRIAELARHTDRVALILDGRCARRLEGDDVTQEAIAAGLVTGRATHERGASSTHALRDAGTVLRVEGWTHHAGTFTGIDLALPAGGIVAIIGVEGSGARELVRSIAGLERGHGRRELPDSQGMAGEAAETSFVSADRATSLFQIFSVAENLVSRLDDEIAPRNVWVRRGRVRSIAEDLRSRFQIKAASTDLPIGSLSGGNQQKVAIAAAVVERPRVLVLEEPTRGVDLGSKREIYRLMRDYAAQGHGLVIYCTEVPEVFEAADVAYVVSDGRLSQPLDVPSYSDVEALARAVTRLERHAAEAWTSAP